MGNILFLLTYYLHFVEVHPYFAEGGESGCSVVSSAVTVFPPASIVGALSGIVESKSNRHFNSKYWKGLLPQRFHSDKLHLEVLLT